MLLHVSSEFLPKVLVSFSFFVVQIVSRTIFMWPNRTVSQNWKQRHKKARWRLHNSSKNSRSSFSNISSSIEWSAFFLFLSYLILQVERKFLSHYWPKSLLRNSVITKIQIWGKKYAFFVNSAKSNFRIENVVGGENQVSKRLKNNPEFSLLCKP